jgi:hypothetical protein
VGEGGEGVATRMCRENPRLLAARLAEALPTLDTGEQEVAITLVRLPGEGEPVPVSCLAAAVGRPADALEDQLTRWSGLLFRDDRGRVIDSMASA